MRSLGLAIVLTGCFSVANTPAPKACLAGEASRFDGETWLCEPITLGSGEKPVCPGGFAAWNGGGWSCAVSAPHACPDSFPTWTGAGWSCGTFPTPMDLSALVGSPQALAAHFGTQTVPANTPGVALSTFGTLSGAPVATTGGSTDPGCLTVTHNWNTNAIGYSAWYSDTATGTRVWVPVPPQANLSGQNVALNKPVAASPSSTLAAAAFIADGMDSTRTGFATPASVIPSGSITIDLGGTYSLSQLSVVMDTTIAGASGQEQWHVSLSDFPGSSEGATLIASGTCNAGRICTESPALSGSPSGRYLSWTCDQSFANSMNNFCVINEIQAYPVAGYSIVQPNANSVRVCNYSGTTRDLALRVSR